MTDRGRGTALAALLAVTVAAGGCGGDDGRSAAAIVKRTADGLGKVRSGELELRVLATPGDEEAGVGFELEGPFSLAGDGALPATRIRFTRVRGEQRSSATLTSTGEEAFVTTGDTTTPLPAAARKQLELGGGSGGKGGTLAALGLRVDEWFVEPEVEDGPELDGKATDRVTGRLRAGRVVADVLRAIRGAGADGPANRKLADAVDGAVRSSKAVLVTGREDGILRRLDLSVDLRPARELEAAIPGVGAVRLNARLGLAEPNRPVKIPKPR